MPLPTAGVAFALITAFGASQASAQSAAQPSAPAATPRFGIIDNSFLVEEAFNQDPRMFQNIFMATRNHTGDWDASFTQEWPVPAERHQLSVTLPFSVESGLGAIGDVLINYRLQVSKEHGYPAFAPRASVVVPSSKEGRELGARGAGCQFNLPFSKQAGALYFHWNAGVTLLRDARTDAEGVPIAEWTSLPSGAGSVIAAVRPMFNLMLETVVQEQVFSDGSLGTTTTFVPGFRTGWYIRPEHQIVIGLGVPLTTGSRHDKAALAYFSYELPFAKEKKKSSTPK